MRKERTFFVADSYKDLKEDMKTALIENDNETIKYNFLRFYRLLKKTRDYIDHAIISKHHDEVEELLKISSKIQRIISKWHAELAFISEMAGEYDLSEREWLSALSFDADAEHYIQYGHAVLRNKNLYVNKDIEENIGFVNIFNVSDIKTSLKRARLAVKSAEISQGKHESTSYFLTWIDLMEKKIDDREDLVQALSSPRNEISLEANIDELNQLIGLAAVKKKIKEISDWVTFTKMRREQGFKTDEISLHMVFSGNPGTGKTSVARIIAKIFKALGVLKKGHLVEVGRSDLVAEYVGQTAIKTMKKIKEAEHGILFIDEAYSLTRSGGNDFGIEAIDTLVKAMEDNRKNLVVILAGYPNEMRHFIQTNPGLYSRFKYHVDFPDYSIDELMKIHSVLLKEKQYKITNNAEIIVKRIIEESISSKTNQHGNGRLVRNIIEDEILLKASFVVEKKRNNLSTGELDLIDDTIINMLEIDTIAN